MDENKNVDQNDTGSFQLPNKAFFTLAEACSYKGLNYKTASNKRTLQPNKGIPDGKLGGRKVWGYKTIAGWISQLDDELLQETERSGRCAGLTSLVTQKAKRAS